MEKIKGTLYAWSLSFNDIPAGVWRKHLFLFAATYISMTWTYYSYSLGGSILARLVDSFLYSSVLISILLAHELGHFIHARQYGVATTLPLFIPLPFFSPFGTLGAFIRMKSLPPDKRALFDISYWGPAMSFFTSIPAIVIGLLFSERVPLVTVKHGYLVGNSELMFGGSIIFDALARVLIQMPEDYTVLLHPVAFAGWVGLFVTAINLFPIGQLDGGHVAYVFLGKRQKYIAYLFFGILIFLALEVSPGWTFWIFMLFFMGLRHPNIRMLEAGIHLDKMRIRQGLLAGIFFIVCFIPEPIINFKIQSVPPVQMQQNDNEFQNFHNINYFIDSEIKYMKIK